MSDGRLFDVGPETPKEKKLSATRSLTLRNNAKLARGVHPATGVGLLAFGTKLSGDTCGDCKSLRRTGDSRRYYKCALVAFTHGPATDIRKSWSACEKFEQAGL